MTTTQRATKNLIDAFIATRGCSRLNAAMWAAQACLDEYNRIQGELGSTAESVVVDRAWLNEHLTPKS